MVKRAHSRKTVVVKGASHVVICLPGTMAGKGQVFGHLKWHPTSDGVLQGATILGDEAGRKLMAIYKRKGIFGNRHDTRHALELALRQHFAQVNVRIEGTVALFEARQPVF
ncbi:MAG TPA: hypothetical protein VL614_15785 [Acetobacteraceae bacterium]|nr:hypothetical protein [Acetobacteraceae bacterium]